MKKIFITLSTLVLLTACGGSNTETKEGATISEVSAINTENKVDKIIGKWQLDAVSGENLTENEKTAITNFKKDGSFVQIKGANSREGKWDFVESSSFINMNVGERNEPLVLVSCDDEYLRAIITRDGTPSNDTLTLKRIN